MEFGLFDVTVLFIWLLVTGVIGWLGYLFVVRHDELVETYQTVEEIGSENKDDEAGELLGEPTGEDSDDESPYGIEDRDLEAALSANDMKIKETQDEWTLEEQSLEEKTLTSE